MALEILIVDDEADIRELVAGVLEVGATPGIRNSCPISSVVPFRLFRRMMELTLVLLARAIEYRVSPFLTV